MMTTKMMKRTAMAVLVGVMSYGAAGAAEVSASALSVPEQRASYTSFDGRDDVQQLAWKSRRDRDRDRWERDRDRDRWERDRDRRDRERWERDRDRDHRNDRRRRGKRYSQGSINTAVIAGAVIGAIIARSI